MKLAGKVAIVTGAGAGIGRATSLLFASQGAHVVHVDIDDQPNSSLAKELSAAGASQSLAQTADVSTEQDVTALVNAVIDRFGRIDILFNNAGIVPVGTLHETTLEDWERAFRVNVTSVFLLSHAVVPKMLAQKSGVILNTASATALRAVPNRAAYNSTKAAVVSLTKSMALDYAAQKIRVNCLCPGTIDTPSLRARIAQQGGGQDAWDAFLARQPLGRLGQAEEIAQAALYLVSEDASFITGTALQIDGGMAI